MTAEATIHPFSLENKNVLITGASSGIGRQCAINASEMGARIVLLGRSIEGLEETASLLTPGSRYRMISFDLTAVDNTPQLINELVEENGRIDALVNCAGISSTTAFVTTQAEMMDQMYRTNVLGPMQLTREVLKKNHFSKQGGSVVFIGSVMATAGEKGKSNYGMSKGALLAATRSLAVEYAPRKIRVNCISPGVVQTPMSKASVYSQDLESIAHIESLHPLGLGAPEDVAGAIVFLLSDASRWITGSNLVVDGGYTAR